MSALAIARPSVATGLAKSARLMRALGPEATPVWNELSPQEARALSAAMDALDDDLRDETDTLASYKQAHERTGAQAASEAPVWAKVSDLETRDLLQLAQGQHPQALALMLSRLDGKASARLLKAIKKPVAVDVMQRLLHLGPAHASAIAALESAVPGAGERVRALMFTFDDLTHLDAGGLQTLLSAADRTRLTYALKGAREETRAAFFRNMTQRAGELLREEIDILGAVRRSEIETARMELVDLARTLIERGDIRAGRPQDEDELVE